MAISRNNLAAAVAGTLSVAMLAGCPNPGTPSTTPSATPSATTSVTPSASTAPSAAPSGEVSPTVAPSPSTIGTSTLRGTVYDTEGAKINGGKLTVKSLNPSNPFDSTVDIINGSYVVNNVPAGVQLQIAASKAGYTTRTIVETLLPLSSNAQQTAVDFGSNAANADGLNDHPQIIAVEPADKATGVASDKLTVKVTLSEALDATNRSRFANLLQVTGATGGAADSITGTAAIKDGTQFNGADTAVATVSWDADGKVATLTFNAPIISDTNNETGYEISLGSTKTDINAIVDDQNNGFQLNGAAPGGDGTTAGVFYIDNKVVNKTTFKVAKDTTAPTLEGVAVQKIGTERVILLTFSKPMAAYKVPVLSPALDEFDNNAATSFHFAVGETLSDITKTASQMETANTAPNSSQVKNTVYNFGSFDKVELDKTNAKVIRLTPPSPFAFDDKFKAIKVWVAGSVNDPAGNGLSTSNDTNIKTATFN